MIRPELMVDVLYDFGKFTQMVKIYWLKKYKSHNFYRY